MTYYFCLNFPANFSEFFFSGDPNYIEDQVSGGSSLEHLNCIVANIPLEGSGSAS